MHVYFVYINFKIPSCSTTFCCVARKHTNQIAKCYGNVIQLSYWLHYAGTLSTDNNDVQRCTGEGGGLGKVQTD